MPKLSESVRSSRTRWIVWDCKASDACLILSAEYKWPISRRDERNICSRRKRSLGLSSTVRILRPAFIFCIRCPFGNFATIISTNQETRGNNRNYVEGRKNGRGEVKL